MDQTTKERIWKEFVGDQEWGYARAFQLNDRIKAAEKIIRSLKYREENIYRWNDLTVAEIDQKLTKLKLEAYQFEQAHKDKDTQHC